MTLRTIVVLAIVLASGASVGADQPPPAAAQPAQSPRAATPQPSKAPAPASAQGQPPRAPAPAPPQKVAASTAPRRQFQPVNIKVEFTLTDQRAGSAPIKRTMSVIVADGGAGQIRSQADVVAIGPVPLNIDTNPEIVSDDKIRLGFVLQYDFFAPIDDKSVGRGTVAKTQIHDSVSLILENGKPMIAAQSADPIADRQVTIEVKATILR